MERKAGLFSEKRRSVHYCYLNILGELLSKINRDLREYPLNDLSKLDRIAFEFYKRRYQEFCSNTKKHLELIDDMDNWEDCIKDIIFKRLEECNKDSLIKLKLLLLPYVNSYLTNEESLFTSLCEDILKIDRKCQFNEDFFESLSENKTSLEKINDNIKDDWLTEYIKII